MAIASQLLICHGWALSHGVSIFHSGHRWDWQA